METCLFLADYRLLSIRRGVFTSACRRTLHNLWLERIELQDNFTFPSCSYFACRTDATQIKPEFSTSALLTFGTRSFFVGERDHPVHCEMFSSILDLYPRDASSTLHPQLWQTKMSPDMCPAEQNHPRLTATELNLTFGKKEKFFSVIHHH